MLIHKHNDEQENEKILHKVQKVRTIKQQFTRQTATAISPPNKHKPVSHGLLTAHVCCSTATSKISWCW
jgi:hypothetical protein